MFKIKCCWRAKKKCQEIKDVKVYIVNKIPKKINQLLLLLIMIQQKIIHKFNPPKYQSKCLFQVINHEYIRNP